MSFSLKSFLPRTLFGRSLLILVTPVLVIQIVTAYVFFDSHWKKITGRLTFAVAGEMAVIADNIEISANEAQRDDIFAQAAKRVNLLGSFKEGGKLEDVPQKGKKRTILVDTLDRAMETQVRRPHRIDADSREKWVEVDIQLENGLLHVSLPQRRLFSSSSYVFLLWMMATSVLLLSVAILFMRNQIRPIRRLAIAADRMGRGLDIPASFKPEGAYEVRQAGRAFMDMHERIRRQIQQRTAMLAGVSHDLRTALTRMKLQAAMLPFGPDVEALKTDIDDMERMLNAYLDFARGEGGEQSHRADIKDMIERVAAGARRQGVKIECGAQGDLSMQLRPVAFERCLNNIVGNAQKFADHIKIDAVRGEQAVTITVDDDGPGVPESQYEEVFKPFVRGEPSRNPATGGVGLGLPIAQDIVHAHGGSIGLSRSPMGGLRVTIILPV